MPADAHGDKESPGTSRGFPGEVMSHRDQGAVDALILSRGTNQARRGSRKRPDCRLQKRPPHACRVISNGCCDVSAPRGAVFKLSPAPLPSPKLAIACRSCDVELEPPMEPVGGSAAKPPSCQSKPTEPNAAAPVIWLLAMS